MTDIDTLLGKLDLETKVRERIPVLTVLCLVAVALVVTAWLAESYVPLFFVWVPQLGIPFYLSRSSRRRAGTATPG